MTTASDKLRAWLAKQAVCHLNSHATLSLATPLPVVGVSMPQALLGSNNAELLRGLTIYVVPRLAGLLNTSGVFFCFMILKDTNNTTYFST